jgi:hypothetical protein
MLAFSALSGHGQMLVSGYNHKLKADGALMSITSKAFKV